MEEERIDPQDVRRLSQALTACNVALGGYLAISFFGFFRSMRELFEGMSLALPLATKLMLSPLAALVPVVLVMVVVAKEVVLNTRPLDSLRWNVYLFVALGIVAMVMLKGMFGPLIQLVGNLG